MECVNLNPAMCSRFLNCKHWNHDIAGIKDDFV
jgi:hypothetical protein